MNMSVLRGSLQRRFWWKQEFHWDCWSLFSLVYLLQVISFKNFAGFCFLLIISCFTFLHFLSGSSTRWSGEWHRLSKQQLHSCHPLHQQRRQAASERRRACGYRCVAASVAWPLSRVACSYPPPVVITSCEHFRNARALGFFSLRHFGHLSHSYIKTRHSSVH